MVSGIYHLPGQHKAPMLHSNSCIVALAATLSRIKESWIRPKVVSHSSNNNTEAENEAQIDRRGRTQSAPHTAPGQGLFPLPAPDWPKRELTMRVTIHGSSLDMYLNTRAGGGNQGETTPEKGHELVSSRDPEEGRGGLHTERKHGEGLLKESPRKKHAKKKLPCPSSWPGRQEKKLESRGIDPSAKMPSNIAPFWDIYTPILFHLQVKVNSVNSADIN